MNIKDLLTIKVAAKYMGVTPNTLRNWEAAGKIKALRNPINGYRLYERSELDRILKSIYPEEEERCSRCKAPEAAAIFCMEDNQDQCFNFCRDCIENTLVPALALGPQKQERQV